MVFQPTCQCAPEHARQRKLHHTIAATPQTSAGYAALRTKTSARQLGLSSRSGPGEEWQSHPEPGLADELTGNGVPHFPSKSPHEQPSAFCKRSTVVSRMFTCPASIFWMVRMLRSTRSASCSWVNFRARRSRRRLPPKARSWADCRGFNGTPHWGVFSA